MNSLGIYFGPRNISIAELKGRALKCYAQVPQTAAYAGELEEKVPAEAKSIEIVAFLKDELRKNSVAAQEAVLSLSGQDMLIRTFEIPVLPREELKSAVNFEAKKYIPFKMEDLISDFQIRFDKVARLNSILYVGIRREVLERYLSIAGQLGLKINGVDYSGFSMLNYLSACTGVESGIIAALGVDLKDTDEANFIVLDKGFPLFSRDISLGPGAELLKPGEPPAPGSALERLKTEVRVSLDYYHRKFPASSIRKFYLLCNEEHAQEMEGFMKEIGLAVQVVNNARALQAKYEYSLGLVKSCGAALGGSLKSAVRLNLIQAAEKLRAPKEAGLQKKATVLLRGLRVHPVAALAGLAICAGVFGWGLYQTQPFKAQLAEAIGRRPQVSTVDPETSYADLAAKSAQYKAKLDTLDNVVKKQLYLTLPLDAIPRDIPAGVWLTDFSFIKNADGRAVLNLNCAAYLADSNKEFEAANNFLKSMKKDRGFSNYFREINLVNLSRGEVADVTATVFSISCGN